MARPTEAFVSANLFDLGLGYVVFTRFRSGEAETGAFLLDVHCLGLKDALYTRLSETEYAHVLLDKLLPADKRKPLDPPTARKLVEDAVAYAQRLGFAPHADYSKARRVFGGTDASAATTTFTFGRNGKPFYVQGQYDSFAKCLRILQQLRARCGDGNFDFLVFGDERDIRELKREGFRIQQQFPVSEPEEPE